MQFQLAYGKGTLNVELPEANVVQCLGYQPATPLADPTQTLQSLLFAPNGTPSLASLAAGKRSACIVISDRSRPVPNRILLPPILETLEAAGIARDTICILVGTGLHPVITPEEILEIVGPEIANRYSIVSHDARDEATNRRIGESPRGIPVVIDSRYLDAELKILTGLIEPHFMAGYSGGRKSICPGIAGRETICTWHSPRFIEHENARFGKLDGNPIHEEAVFIARAAGCDFIVNAVIDAERRILDIFAGDLEAAHRDGVTFARQLVTATISEPVDIVVTSAAGYPLDNSWYQSIKGVVAALDILKPGGTIVLASACGGGIGNAEFEQIAAKFKTIDAFMEAIHGDFFIINQWQVEELAMALTKCKVRVVTGGLPPEVLSQYYVQPAASVEAAVAEAMAEYGPNATIAVLPEGPYVLAEVARAE